MKALVTGGTGFLGKRLAKSLHEQGWEVTALGRQRNQGAELEAAGIRFLSMDLRDESKVVMACLRQDAVFHCGALSAPWGPYREFYECNVLGTEHVIEGCLRHDVPRLIHVSTPSVYFDYKERLHIREQDALPKRFVNAYAQTKRLAELAVERAAAQKGLPAVIIRPRALYGPGDTTILPRLIRANEAKGVPWINGGQALVDLTYVDNVVHALLLCQSAADQVVGRTYNITNGQPMPFGDALKLLFLKLSIPLQPRSMSYSTAYTVAGVLELAAKLFQGGKEPLMTRYLAGTLGLSQTLDISAARKELGYDPVISVEAGMDQFATWWRSQS